MHIVGASDSLLFLRKLVVSLLLWHAVPTAILFLRHEFFLPRAFFLAHDLTGN